MDGLQAIAVRGLKAGASASQKQIIGILREQEAGVPVADPCRTYGLSSPIFYKCKARFGSMDVSESPASEALEDENAWLKRMLAHTSFGA